MVNYPIADMLIRIKNAQAVRHEQVLIPFSKMKWAIGNILQQTDYVAAIERVKKPAHPGSNKKTEHEYILVTLKYEDGMGSLNGVNIISKPSRHMYVTASQIKPVRSGHGIAIISTSKGVMSSRDAKKAGVGGELICEVW